MERSCLNCGEKLNGRADKKYCDDYCRNAYNNKLNSSSNNLIRNINNALMKNRRILASIITDKEETAKAHEDKMIQNGFQFKYHTHQYQNKKGQIYYFCYEYGYIELENKWYLIVKRNSE